VDYNAETTTHTEEAITLYVVYDTETTTQAATLSVVYDAETTTHTEEAITPFVVYDVETTTQRYYIAHNNRTLSQINHHCWVRPCC
jgi:hypothetical protein